MGQHLGKRDALSVSKGSSTVSGQIITESLESQDEVFGLGEADMNKNNGCYSKSPVVTDSMNAAVHQSSWNQPSTAELNASGPRPHLVRLFSRDAPGREDNTFKDRPSESDELQTIQEHGGTGSECGSECADSSQSTFRLGRSKKNPTVMDQIGKFFGGDKRRKGKGSFRGALSASPQRSSTSPRRRANENAVVHFFRTIVSHSAPKSRGEQKSQGFVKGQKGRGDSQGTLTRIFKRGGSQSASSTKR